MRYPLAAALIVLGVLTGGSAPAQEKQGGPDGPGANLRAAGQSDGEIRKENREIRNEEHHENRRNSEDDAGWEGPRR